MNEKTQEKITRLQHLEQNMQNLLVQKQKFQSQLVEAEAAIVELDSASESYKIIGNIMVRMDPGTLKSSLKEKIETIELRVKSLEKQEEKIKSQAEDIKKEVMEALEKEGK